MSIPVCTIVKVSVNGQTPLCGGSSGGAPAPVENVLLLEDNTTLLLEDNTSFLLED